MRPSSSELTTPTFCFLPLAWSASKSSGARNGDRRREARDRDDESLVAAMRSNPDGSIGDWAMTIRKSRTSCVSALQRLRAAGLAQSVEGKWKLTAPPAPPARWTAPVSATQRAHAHA